VYKVVSLLVFCFTDCILTLEITYFPLNVGVAHSVTYRSQEEKVKKISSMDTIPRKDNIFIDKTIYRL
jgi:hypothetical protein